MKPHKSPAFQMYVEDFLVGTGHFTAEQIGAYLLLLFKQWDKGSLPDNDDELMRIGRVKKSVIGVIKIKFKKNKKDGLLRNERLEKERKKQIAWKKKSAEAGIKSGLVRKAKKLEKEILVEPNAKVGSKVGSVLVEPNANSSLSLSLSSSSSFSSSSKNGDKELLLKIANEPFFEMFRRVAGEHISNNELLSEINKFKNKYPNAHPNQSGALINTWVGNIGRIPEKKQKDFR